MERQLQPCSPKQMGSRAQAPELDSRSESQLHHSQAVERWASHLTAPGLSFLVYKMGLVSAYCSRL